MKDLAGIELQEGDLILYIKTGWGQSALDVQRTNWAQCVPSIISGGITQLQKVRFIMWNGYRDNSYEKHILKVSPQHALEELKKIKENFLNTNILSPNNAYRQDSQFWEKHWHKLFEDKYNNFTHALEEMNQQPA